VISARRGKENENFQPPPPGEVQDPSVPFHVTSMDIVEPYCVAPRKNNYLLTIIDHFTKYVDMYYDKTAKERKIEVNDKVYLFCPARKSGGCRKFRSFW
jgi:hypothetical protein